MTKASVIISIPTPCHESWEAMTPADKGRFCQSCQKTVTDFSNMSDQQIMSYLKQRQGEVCGRFHAEQLNREISVPANIRKQPFAPIAAMVAALTIAIPSVQAQNKVEKIQPAPDRSNPTPQQIDTLPHIRGIVIDVDGTDKYVLPQAIILLKGQGISTLSDTSGKFELSIPPDYKEENITLEVSLPGYLSKEVAVTRNDTEYVEIRLDINKRTTQYSWVMGAVTTITAIDLTSEPNSWQRFKYKVGHLFR